MNEKKFVEQQLINGALDLNKCSEQQKWQYLRLWVRYKLQCGFSDKDIIEEIETILNERGVIYNHIKFRDKVCIWHEKGNKYPLYEIDKIDFSHTELELLKSIRSEPTKRLFFSMMAYSKFFDKVNPNNNHWCNISTAELKKCAKLSVTNQNYLNMLDFLHNANLIEWNYHVSNFRVIAEVEDSPVALSIYSLNNLGLQYMATTNRGKRFVVQCRKCGEYFKKKSPNEIVCPNCKTNI